MQILYQRAAVVIISAGASVYLASVLEYMAAELLELAGDAARDNKRSRISPRHIFLAVHADDELNILLGRTIISQGGVMPHIEPALLKGKVKVVPA